MTNKATKYTILSFIAFYIFTSGIIVGKLDGFKSLVIDKSINIVEFGSILITLIVAYWVTTVLDKNKQDVRQEKDLILKRLDDAYDIIEEISQNISDGSISYTTAASYVKRINMTINTIYRVSEKSSFTINTELKEETKKLINNLRDLLTNSPQISEKDVENSKINIQVKDGIIKYANERISEIENAFDRIKDHILNLELDINRS